MSDFQDSLVSSVSRLGKFRVAEPASAVVKQLIFADLGEWHDVSIRPILEVATNLLVLHDNCREQPYRDQSQTGTAGNERDSDITLTAR